MREFSQAPANSNSRQLSRLRTSQLWSIDASKTNFFTGGCSARITVVATIDGHRWLGYGRQLNHQQDNEVPDEALGNYSHKATAWALSIVEPSDGCQRSLLTIAKQLPG